MDRVEDTLETIVQREVIEYSNRWGEKISIYYISNETKKVYSAMVIPEVGNKMMKIPNFMVLARIVGDYVLIEADNTDKPLVDALVYNGGIPREKIILRYAGETLPEDLHPQPEGD
jgi:hypothetical protein